MSTQKGTRRVWFGPVHPPLNDQGEAGPPGKGPQLWVHPPSHSCGLPSTRGGGPGVVLYMSLDIMEPCSETW